MNGGHTFTPLPTWSGSLGDPKELPPIEWQPTELPVLTEVVQSPRNVPQPANWPFPALDTIQARNHLQCVQSLRRLEQRRHQQRLQEALEAIRAQAGEALL